MTALIFFTFFLVSSMYFALTRKGFAWVWWSCFMTPAFLILTWVAYAVWITQVLPLPKWGDVPL